VAARGAGRRANRQHWLAEHSVMASERMQAGAIEGRLIWERKHHPDGRCEAFECVLLRLSNQVAAVRFDHSGGAASRYGLAVGSYTIGYFWQGRGYNLYRIRDPEGGRVRDRFDIIRDCRISAGAIDYTDLFVDVVADGTGRISVEDEEELDAAVARGLLSAADRDAAMLALAEVAGSYIQIIEAAEHFWPAARRA